MSFFDTMKEITGFEDCIKYIHFLGAIKRTNDYPIYMYQADLDSVANRILKASGNESWYSQEFKKFKIRYNRKENTFYVIKWFGLSIVSCKLTIQPTATHIYEEEQQHGHDNNYIQ